MLTKGQEQTKMLIRLFFTLIFNWEINVWFCIVLILLDDKAVFTAIFFKHLCFLHNFKIIHINRIRKRLIFISFSFDVLDSNVLFFLYSFVFIFSLFCAIFSSILIHFFHTNILFTFLYFRPLTILVLTISRPLNKK